MRRSFFFTIFFFASIAFAQRGVVLDAVTREGLANARVVISHIGVEARTLSNGSFDFQGKIAGLAGEIILIIERDGYERTEVHGDAMSRFTILLRRFETQREEAPTEYTFLSSQFSRENPPSLFSYTISGDAFGERRYIWRGLRDDELPFFYNGISLNDPEDYHLDSRRIISSSDLIPHTFFSIKSGVLIAGENHKKVEEHLDAGAGAGSFATAFAGVDIGMRGAHAGNDLAARAGAVRSAGYRTGASFSSTKIFLEAHRAIGENFFANFFISYAPYRSGLAGVGLPKSFAAYDDSSRMNLTSAGAPRNDVEGMNVNTPLIGAAARMKISNALKATVTLLAEPWLVERVEAEPFADSSRLRLGTTYGYSPQNPVNIFVRNERRGLEYGIVPSLVYSQTSGEAEVGILFREYSAQHTGTIYSANALPASLETNRSFFEYTLARKFFGIFLEERWKPTKELDVKARLEYSSRSYNFSGEKFSGNSFNVSYLFIEPTLDVSYHANDVLSFLVGAKLRSREPAFRYIYDADNASAPNRMKPAMPLFEYQTHFVGGAALRERNYEKPFVTPTTYIEFEAGPSLATKIFGCPTDVALTGFYTKVIDAILPTTGRDSFGNFLYEKGQLHHVGAEFAGSIALDSKVLLHATASLSQHSVEKSVRYTFIDSSSNFLGVPGNKTTVAGVPDVLASLAIDYSPMPSMKLRVATRYVGGYQTSFTTTEKISSYAVCDAALFFTAPFGFTVSGALELSAENIFDVTTNAAGIGTDFFPLAPRSLVVRTRITL